MATTTNYGWTTPDDTSLVKDGASAIRTLGSSVDTTVKNLNPETTLGDISYRSSTANTNTRLAIGTSGQVLTVSSGVPAWTTISSGGITLISEQTMSAASSLSFSSISGSYKQLLLVWSGLNHSTSGSTFDLRFNNDSGSNYLASSMGVYSNSATSSDGPYTSAGGSLLFGQSANATTSTLQRSPRGFFLLDNYSSTTKLKTYRWESAYRNTGATDEVRNQTGVGVWNSTSAITSLDIVRISGTATITNVTDTSIRLYGLS